MGLWMLRIDCVQCNINNKGRTATVVSKITTKGAIMIDNWLHMDTSTQEARKEKANDNSAGVGTTYQLPSK